MRFIKGAVKDQAESVIVGSGLTLTQDADGRPVLAAESGDAGTPFRARLGLSTNMSFAASATDYPIEWDEEPVDPDAMHDPATNPERLTIPVGVAAGTPILVSVQVTATNSHATDSCEYKVTLSKNGGTVQRAIYVVDALRTDNIAFSLVDECEAGDYYQVNVRVQRQEADQTISGSDGGVRISSFSIAEIR